MEAFMEKLFPVLVVMGLIVFIAWKNRDQLPRLRARIENFIARLK